jgi:hypothetical protein
MELLEGETLRARLAQGPLPVRKAVEIAALIARGLAAAHDKQIAHRDLKPENVFLTPTGGVKILDFGLARDTSADSALTRLESPTMAPATTPGTVLGTVGYMAPEQVRGEPADQRSDIFALGCVLYEMLTGARAFARETAAETMAMILREDPPEPSTVNATVPPGVQRALRRCLEKRPQERFESARDLAFALESSIDSSTSSSAAVLPPRRDRRWLVSAIAAVTLGAVTRCHWHSTTRAPVDIRDLAAGPVSPSDFRQRDDPRRPVHTRRTVDHLRRRVEGSAGQTVHWSGPTAPNRRRCRCPMHGCCRCRDRGSWRSRWAIRSKDGWGRAHWPVRRSSEAHRVWSPNTFAKRTGLRMVRTWRSCGAPTASNGWNFHSAKSSIKHRVHQRHSLLPVGRSHRVRRPSGLFRRCRSRRARRQRGHRTTLSDGWVSVHGIAWSKDGSEIWFGGTKGVAINPDGIFAVTGTASCAQ